MVNTFIHETAIVDDGASIGEGSRIWHWVHVVVARKLVKVSLWSKCIRRQQG